jgi:thymidylate synthase (FAD)
MDSRFTVEVLSQTSNPQQTIYAAMHQDYAEEFVAHTRETFPGEAEAGDLVIKYLLGGNRGHFGPIEHPQIVLNVGWFPHSCMQQIRTHRVGISFDVQCLAAETEVTFVKTSGALHKVKLGELYDLWSNEETAIRDMNLRVLNEETGAFEISHIQDVMCSGTQPVYRLTLEDGKTLDCTSNHRLFTSLGWQHMGDAIGLVTDDQHQVLAMKREAEVMCNGVLVPEKPLVGARIPRPQSLPQHDRFNSTLGQTPAQSIAAPIAGPLNPPILGDFETDLARKSPRIGGLGGDSACHQLMAHPVKVVNVEYLGMQTTYDLEVAGKWHNFVANGLVVHNSFRYTGTRILAVATGEVEVDEVFYLRPLGSYTNRQGKKYEYSNEQRAEDQQWCLGGAKLYAKRIHEGCSEEHARSLIPFDVRQHWVMSANVRSLMHLMDLRAKDDAQLEAQQMCELIWPHFEAWVPAIAAWYKKNRWAKARLSP